jgi:hypothetical protein
MLERCKNGKGYKILLSRYGHDDTIDKIAISLFEEQASWDSANVKTYCKMTNSLELIDNNWIYAKAVSANTPVALTELIPLSEVKFDNIILKLDDRALQKVLRELDRIDLVNALKG